MPPEVPAQPSETPGGLTSSPQTEAAPSSALSPPVPPAIPSSDAPSPTAVTGAPWVDRLLAHPYADMGLLILAVLALAGLWLLLLARRGSRVARQQAEVTPVAARMPPPTSAAAPAADDAQRADPWLKMSELERAIGGRFELPDLEMTAPQPAPASAASSPRPVETTSRQVASRPLDDALNPSPTRLPEAAVNQQLARSLELAAACLRRNEVDRARRLLEDVVRSGDETQREFARALLSRLG
ncbi:MAG: hypothetical protein KGR68_10670 [Betaproteobacteria bacterium]|nr:hypothetical protein [Betaproteobacteria bacterium]